MVTLFRSNIVVLLVLLLGPERPQHLSSRSDISNYIPQLASGSREGVCPSLTRPSCPKSQINLRISLAPSGMAFGCLMRLCLAPICLSTNIPSRKWQYCKLGGFLRASEGHQIWPNNNNNKKTNSNVR